MTKKQTKVHSQKSKSNSNSKKVHRIYFVDFENVHSDALKYSEEVQKGDEIIIFCTSKEKNVNVSYISELQKHGCVIQTKIVSSGSNALDFQLDSYVGYYIHKYEAQLKSKRYEFYIVSNDKGYDIVCSFWQKEYPSIILQRASDLTRKIRQKPKTKTVAKRKPKGVVEKVMDALDDFFYEDVE